MSSKSQDRVSRAARRDATQAAVLEAATEAFTSRGFEGTSLGRIAERAGVPVPLIVYHFGSKLGLWKAVVDGIYEALNADLLDVGVDARPDSREALGEVIRGYVRALVARPAYMRLLLNEGTEASPRLTWLVETHQKPFSERVVALIEEVQRAGLLPADADPMMLKYLCSGAVSLPIALAPEYAAMTGEDATAEAFIDRYTALCLKVLAASD